jgi:hypothetical protein
MRKAVQTFRGLGASLPATSARSRSNQASGRWMPTCCSMNAATLRATIASDFLQPPSRGAETERDACTQWLYWAVLFSASDRAKSRSLGSRLNWMLPIGMGYRGGRCTFGIAYHEKGKVNSEDDNAGFSIRRTGFLRGYRESCVKQIFSSIQGLILTCPLIRDFLLTLKQTTGFAV